MLVLSILPLSPVYAQASPETLPTSSLEVFPKLPPSSLCTREKLIGIWKLIMIYEVPPGTEMKIYTINPLQYYVFDANTRYGQYMSMLRAITLQEVKDIAIKQQKDLQQFSVKSGMLFLYKDNVAVDSLACFIVARHSAPFMAGQLLLMPTEKAARGRLVKVYQKMFLEFEAGSRIPTAAGAELNQ